MRMPNVLQKWQKKQSEQIKLYKQPAVLRKETREFKYAQQNSIILYNFISPTYVVAQHKWKKRKI